MLTGRWALAGLAVGAGAIFACLTPKPPEDERPVSNDVDRGPALNCKAVHAPVEPALIGLDPGARAALDRQRRDGLVVVRYSGHGCGVKLEVLPTCIAPGGYAFTPYSTTESVLARTANEVYEDFPLAASHLVSRLADRQALRADVMLAGILSVKKPRVYHSDDLKGECAGATDIVAKIYVGGFAMAAGEARTLEGLASLLRAGSDGGNAVILQREGAAKACEDSQENAVETAACDVPIRVALLPIAVPCDPDAGGCGQTAEGPPDASADGGSEGAQSGMVHVRAGTFTMGARSHTDAKNDPAHKPVTVAAFDLDANEVTAGDYAACVDATQCSAGSQDQPTCNYGRADRKDHPMNCVDWSQASVYCHAQGKRLPTEEEWEYAARGGAEERAYPWGSAEPAQQLCWSGIAKRDGTCPVRAFAAGAYGLYDMAGNVSEWTSSPSSPDRRDTRVYRGGGWSDARALDFRGAYRDAHAPTNKDGDLGFRCAR